MTVKNFNEATAFVAAISRVWALRNFTPRENKIRFFFSWFYNIFVLLFSITLILSAELFQFVELDYNTEGIVYRYLILVYIFMISWILILGWYHSKNLLAFKKLVCKVDEDLRTLGSTFNYRSILLQIVLIGSFWFCCTTIVTALYVKWLLKGGTLIHLVLNVLSYFYGNNVGSIMLLDFKTNVFWIGLKFKQTNELLNSVLLKNNRKEEIDTISESIKNSYDRPESDHRQLKCFSPSSKIFPENYFDATYKPQSTKTIFRQIRFVHQQLCCTTKVLSKTFDSQLLIFSAHTAVYATVVCYYLYIEIRKTMSLHKLELNLLTILIVDAFFEFIKICIVTYNCEYAMKQANKTTEIVHEFALSQADAELKEEILQFSLQISHARLGKSKINFFSLNYNFLRGWVGFVTTYLIIIIQFSKNSELTYETSALNTTPTEVEVN